MTTWGGSISTLLIELGLIIHCLQFLDKKSRRGRDKLHLVLFSTIKLCTMYGYVPDDFGVGVVVPVVKDQCADLCSADSHCPVTLV